VLLKRGQGYRFPMDPSHTPGPRMARRFFFAWAAMGKRRLRAGAGIRYHGYPGKGPA